MQPDPRLAIVVMLAVSPIVGAHPPQREQPTPAFEVASVKPSSTPDARTYFQIPPSGTVSVTNATVRMLVRAAYEIDIALERFTLASATRSPLLRGTDAFEDQASPRFDIQAKIPEGTRPGQQFAMLRTLLAERFKLRTHTETRQLPVYALKLAREGRLGPRLRTSSGDCDTFFAERTKNKDVRPPSDADGQPLCLKEMEFLPGGVSVHSAGGMMRLARQIQTYTDRPVLNATELGGFFEWTFSIDLAADPNAPPIFSVVQDQLGLRLEPSTGPFEVLVIDSVEMPSPN